MDYDTQKCRISWSDKHYILGQKHHLVIMRPFSTPFSQLIHLKKKKVSWRPIHFCNMWCFSVFSETIMTLSHNASRLYRFVYGQKHSCRQTFIPMSSSTNLLVLQHPNKEKILFWTQKRGKKCTHLNSRALARPESFFKSKKCFYFQAGVLLWQRKEL